MQRFKPQLEQLEDRTVPYSVSTPWADNAITWSIMPDGTMFDNMPSTMYADFDAKFGAGVWQAEIERAFETWEQVANIDFTQVADDGTSQSATGKVQGDSRFGDIRIGSIPFDTYTGYAYKPGDFPGIKSGDIKLDSEQTNWNIHIGQRVDLCAIMIHEIGHAIGIRHSANVDALMYSGFRAFPDVALHADDINAVRNLYGARPASFFEADPFETWGGNNSSLTATNLGTVEFASLVANDHSSRDVDYYKFKAPTSGTYTITVDGSAALNGTTAKTVNKFLNAGSTYTFSVRAATLSEYNLSVSKVQPLAAEVGSLGTKTNWWEAWL